MRQALPLLARGFDMAQVAAAATGSDQITLTKNRGQIVGVDFLLETAPTTLFDSTIQLAVGGRNVIESAMITEFYFLAAPAQRKAVELLSSGGQVAQWTLTNSGVLPIDASVVFFHENRFNCREWWQRFRKRYTGLKTRTYPFIVLAGAKTTVSDVIPTDQGDVIGLELITSPTSSAVIVQSRHTVRINGETIIENMGGAPLWNESTFLWKIFPILIKRSSTFEWDIDNNGGADVYFGIKFYFDDSR